MHCERISPLLYYTRDSTPFCTSSLQRKFYAERHHTWFTHTLTTSSRTAPHLPQLNNFQIEALAQHHTRRFVYFQNRPPPTEFHRLVYFFLCRPFTHCVIRAAPLHSTPAPLLHLKPAAPRPARSSSASTYPVPLGRSTGFGTACSYICP